MSIDQTHVIDFISLSLEGKVELTLSDHHSWDEASHLQLLQDKLNSYLRFIESGQMFQDYPNAVGRELYIQAVMKFQPTPEACLFLEEAKAIMDGAGVGFRWKVLNFNE